MKTTSYRCNTRGGEVKVVYIKYPCGNCIPIIPLSGYKIFLVSMIVFDLVFLFFFKKTNNPIIHFRLFVVNRRMSEKCSVYLFSRYFTDEFLSLFYWFPMLPSILSLRKHIIPLVVKFSRSTNTFVLFYYCN